MSNLSVFRSVFFKMQEAMSGPRPTVDPVPFVCGDCGPEPYYYLQLAQWNPLIAAIVRNDHYEKHYQAEQATGTPALVGPLHGGMGCIA